MARVLLVFFLQWPFTFKTTNGASSNEGLPKINRLALWGVFFMKFKLKVSRIGYFGGVTFLK